VTPVEVLMRRSGDSRPDYEAKGALMRDLIERRAVVMALDDREPVCEQYTALGVRCVVIESNNLNQVVNETYRLNAD